ncbi:MAG: hypothetical protein KDB29_01495, partial [Planctomycetes bacterium]|nr:hypothetical protein [Planctomycetota bacterium]
QAVAVDDAGGFIVVWSSYLQDGSGNGVFAQRYSAAGATIGNEFQVNTWTTGDQHYANVAVDSDGDFVVVWQGSGSGGGGSDIYAQLFSKSGAAVGGEFRVNASAYFACGHSSVAMDDQGNFVIVWTSSGSQDGDGDGVFGRRFAANGAAQGSEFQVNTSTTDDQKTPVAAMDNDGDFVVCWRSEAQSSSGVYAQRYSNIGATIGAEFKVGATTSTGQLSPSVAMDADGDFVVAWETGGSASTRGAWLQRYDNTGASVGSETRANTTPTSSSYKLDVAVAMDAAGNYTACWGTLSSSGLGYDVLAQRYSNTGATIGSEFVVNSVTTNDQKWPAVAAAPNGNIVGVWSSDGPDGDSFGVFGQRYGVPLPLISLTVTSKTFVEDDSPTLLDGAAALSWPTASIGSGYLLVEYTTGPLAEDELQIVQTSFIRRNGADVEYDPTGAFSGAQIVIGSVSGAGAGSGLAGADLQVDLSSNCTAVIAGELIQACAYYTSSQNPSALTRTLRLTIDDGSGTMSNQPLLDLAVVPVNDPPSFTASNPPSVVEDAGSQIIPNWASFSPGPAAESGQSVQAYAATNLSNPGLFAVLPAIDPSGTLTYTPGVDSNGTCTFDVTVTDDGGTASGGLNVSPPQLFTIDVSSVNDPPTLTAVALISGGPIDAPVDISYATLESAANEADVDNTTLSFRIEGVVSGSLLLNGNPVVPGTSLLSPGDVLNWTPPAGQSGSLAGFTVVASDGTMVSTSPVTVLISVGAVSSGGDGSSGDEGCSTQENSSQRYLLVAIFVLVLVSGRHVRSARRSR